MTPVVGLSIFLSLILLTHGRTIAEEILVEDPEVGFSCGGKLLGRFYADVASECRVFHACIMDGDGQTMDIPFACINGTVFDQKRQECLNDDSTPFCGNYTEFDDDLLDERLNHVDFDNRRRRETEDFEEQELKDQDNSEADGYEMMNYTSTGSPITTVMPKMNPMMPKTSFSCMNRQLGQYYVDIEADCQLFHICAMGIEGEVLNFRFMCLEGMMFNVEKKACEEGNVMLCPGSFITTPVAVTNATTEKDGEEEDEVDDQDEAEKEDEMTTKKTKDNEDENLPDDRGKKSTPSPRIRGKSTTSKRPESKRTKKPKSKDLDYDDEDKDGSAIEPVVVSPMFDVVHEKIHTRVKRQPGDLFGAPCYSYDNLPRTSFNCRGMVPGGYYADPETNCQLYHVCAPGASPGLMIDFRFLCTNNTVFDQQTRTCMDFDAVDCGNSLQYYGINQDLIPPPPPEVDPVDVVPPTIVPLPPTFVPVSTTPPFTAPPRTVAPRTVPPRTASPGTEPPRTAPFRSPPPRTVPPRTPPPVTNFFVSQKSFRATSPPFQQNPNGAGGQSPPPVLQGREEKGQSLPPPTRVFRPSPSSVPIPLSSAPPTFIPPATVLPPEILTPVIPFQQPLPETPPDVTAFFDAASAQPPIIRKPVPISPGNSLNDNALSNNGNRGFNGGGNNGNGFNNRGNNGNGFNNRGNGNGNGAFNNGPDGNGGYNGFIPPVPTALPTGKADIVGDGDIAAANGFVPPPPEPVLPANGVGSGFPQEPTDIFPPPVATIPPTLPPTTMPAKIPTTNLPVQPNKGKPNKNNQKRPLPFSPQIGGFPPLMGPPHPFGPLDPFMPPQPFPHGPPFPLDGPPFGPPLPSGPGRIPQKQQPPKPQQSQLPRGDSELPPPPPHPFPFDPQQAPLFDSPLSIDYSDDYFPVDFGMPDSLKLNPKVSSAKNNKPVKSPIKSGPEGFLPFPPADLAVGPGFNPVPAGSEFIEVWIQPSPILVQGYRVIRQVGNPRPQPHQQSSLLSQHNLPATSFTCRDKITGGYYADLETACQMFHVCARGSAGESFDFKFLCTNDTVFNQRSQTCEVEEKVNCESSPLYYPKEVEHVDIPVPDAEIGRLPQSRENRRGRRRASEDEHGLNTVSIKTGFSCRGKKVGGYFGDAETECRTFHVCARGEAGQVIDFHFRCANETAFNQRSRTCDEFGEVDCDNVSLLYNGDDEFFDVPKNSAKIDVDDGDDDK